MTRLRKCPAQVEKVAEGRLGFGRGVKGRAASSGLACPSHNLLLLTGVAKPAKPVQVSAPNGGRAQSCRSRQGSRPSKNLGPEREDREAPPNLPAQPRGLFTAWGQVGSLSFLSLECSESGLTRATLYVPPLLVGTAGLLSSCVTMQETRGRSEK